MNMFSFLLMLFLVKDGWIEGKQLGYQKMNNLCRSVSKGESLPFRGKTSLNPSLEHFVVQQLKLEKIAHQSKIHLLSKSEKEERLVELLNSSAVKEIIDDCQLFHLTPQCSKDSRYRSMDGTCNNLKHPKWGSTYSQNLRMLPPLYEGSFLLRKSSTGLELPNARSITVGALRDEDHPSEEVSLLFPLFGQLLDHDITDTPLISFNGSKPVCCTDSDVNRQLCAPVLFSPCDPFYSSRNKTCVEFARSAPYPSCDFSERVPMNAVTSFIDCSPVYGTEQELRTLDGSGKLTSQKSSHGQLLKALSDGTSDDVCPPNATQYCFSAGDSRVNEHAFLTSLQTLFMREHNRVADILHGLNPKWNDDDLYQEARKIIGAEFQNIVCKDFFPYLLGLNHQVCEKSYNEKINPGILTEFSTAAYRLHSMIAHQFNKRKPHLTFMSMYSNPLPIHEGYMDNLVKGASLVPAQENDPAMISDIKNFLYKYPFESFGIDLPTLNIQRGRDHGLPVYTQVAEKCSSPPLKLAHFSDLRPLMPQERIISLQNIYKDVRDIDLWIGLVMERTVPGSVVGPTSLCILSSQFERLITGDRFFYKNKGQPNSFTEEQIEVIENSSLARIICENSHVSEIARNPLLIPSQKNPVESCQAFNPVDFKPWKFNIE